MNVEEAASLLGVSARRVRAMIASGGIRAHRDGTAWVIDELASPKGRRSLSVRSWEVLGRTLKLRTLEGLSGQERSRTAARIRQLRESDAPSRLLIDWRPPNAPRDLYLDSLVAHAARGNDAYIRQALQRPPEYLRREDDLAQVVSSERAILGHSRQWLAEAAGVPETVVRNIETERPLTSPGQVRSVLRVLGIEPTALPNMVLG